MSDRNRLILFLEDGPRVRCTEGGTRYFRLYKEPGSRRTYVSYSFIDFGRFSQYSSPRLALFTSALVVWARIMVSGCTLDNAHVTRANVFRLELINSAHSPPTMYGGDHDHSRNFCGQSGLLPSRRTSCISLIAPSAKHYPRYSSI